MIAISPPPITPSNPAFLNLLKYPAKRDRERLGTRQREARRRRGGEMLHCMIFFYSPRADVFSYVVLLSNFKVFDWFANCVQTRATLILKGSKG